MTSRDAGLRLHSIDKRPRLEDAASNYENLLELVDDVIAALSDSEDDLNAATERIEELERQVEELQSAKENE